MANAARYACQAQLPCDQLAAKTGCEDAETMYTMACPL